MDADQLLSVEPSEVETPETLTYARNIFLPLTTACKNACDYCAFYDRAEDAELMTHKEVQNTLEQGRKAGCTEALYSFGTRPEVYPRIKEQLNDMGYSSILEYLYWACETALNKGLLPHSNPGLLTYEEMQRLKEVNASMGLMLETTAEVEAHRGFESKRPENRLEAIRSAGELGIPFTTGFLVGIGENWRDRAESILAVRRLHIEYGHIQEVIVQNVVPNQRSTYNRPSTESMERMVAMARAGLPDDVEVQAPPNLTPELPRLVRAGVGDLGGVSPVTDDYINPEYEWPAVKQLQSVAEEVGVPLKERLPVYPRYVSNGWVSERVERKARELENREPA